MVRGLILAGLVSLSMPALAEDYVESGELRRLISEWTLNDKIPKDWLEQQFSEVTRQTRVLELFNRPAESSMPFYEYNGIFDTESRAEKGANFWRAHESWLVEAEKTYGVPAEIIVAIIGVETRFGEVMGNYRVIDALTTLALDYDRRAEFFTRELREFILLSREEGRNATEFMGSYAGAMGLPQFMPSSYRAYAVDFDKDGQRDIWQTPADAIGSVGSYLERNGWRAGEPIVVPALVRQGVAGAPPSRGLRPDYTLGELRRRGVSFDIVDGETADATFFYLDGPDGAEGYVGLHNFYVITRYNRSRMYAMAVFNLAERIKSLRGE